MRWLAGIVGLMLCAGAAVAQPFPAADTLTPQELRGRNLFNQSCMVCHVKLQITSPAKYGPDHVAHDRFLPAQRVPRQIGTVFGG